MLCNNICASFFFGYEKTTRTSHNENLYGLIIHSSGETRAVKKKIFKTINSAYLFGNSPCFEEESNWGKQAPLGRMGVRNNRV